MAKILQEHQLERLTLRRRGWICQFRQINNPDCFFHWQT